MRLYLGNGASNPLHVWFYPGFSGSADRMALFPVRSNPRWRLDLIQNKLSLSARHFHDKSILRRVNYETETSRVYTFHSRQKRLRCICLVGSWRTIWRSARPLQPAGPLFSARTGCIPHVCWHSSKITNSSVWLNFTNWSRGASVQRFAILRTTTMMQES